MADTSHKTADKFALRRAKLGHSESVNPEVLLAATARYYLGCC